MDNPGRLDLAVIQISAAEPQSLLIPVDGPRDLSGMASTSIEWDFRYGSGSGTVVAIVVDSVDGGTTWRHLARADFANASLVKKANIQANGAKGITTYADLVAEGVNDGMLGTALALLLTVTGTYVNSTLAVRATPR